jgi:hypothetical protein
VIKAELRERLQARDDKVLDVVRKGEQLQFADWVDFFLENYSKPPTRAEKTYEANGRARRHLKRNSATDRSVRLLRTILSSTFEGGCIRMFRSRPQPGWFKKTVLSQRQSIKSCGCFAVC